MRQVPEPLPQSIGASGLPASTPERKEEMRLTLLVRDQEIGYLRIERARTGPEKRRGQSEPERAVMAAGPPSSSRMEEDSPSVFEDIQMGALSQAKSAPTEEARSGLPTIPLPGERRAAMELRLGSPSHTWPCCW